MAPLTHNHSNEAVRPSGNGEDRQTAPWEGGEVPVVPPVRFLSIGTVVDERFRIDAVLGSGATGLVYRARDRVLGRDVALKLLRAGASEAQLQRFRGEVALAQQLNHPGLVRIYDIGRSGEIDYFSMELIDGESLAARLRTRGRLSVANALRMLLQVARAVRHLHAAGILHRDIKPANILIDRRGRARLGDFGLAASSRDRPTGAGTPSYMAPELRDAAVATQQSDIYALGATFFEAVTGKPPRAGEQLPNTDLFKSDAARSLRQVLAGCLAPEPADRFEHVDRVIKKITEQRGRKTGRRRGPRVAAVLAALVAAALSWAAWTWSEAEAVQVNGTRVWGRNRWGAMVWGHETGATPRVARRQFGISGPEVFSVSAKERRNGWTWLRRSFLVSRRGELLFDSRAVATPLYMDPLREQSGVAVAEPIAWSSGAAPADHVMPFRVVNYPWYLTLFGVATPTKPSHPSVLSSGRVYAVAWAEHDGVGRYGLVVGNHELLHTSGFVIVTAGSRPTFTPPRMVDQTQVSGEPFSYSVLPGQLGSYSGSAIEPRADGWKVCSRAGECVLLDRYGNVARAGTPEEAQRERVARMRFFRELSQLDVARRREMLGVAEEQLAELTARATASATHAAFIHWVGARLAAARGDLAQVVARTRRVEALLPGATDPVFLRADAYLAAGKTALAHKELHRVSSRTEPQLDAILHRRVISAWLSGDHSQAMRLAEDLDMPSMRTRLAALFQVETGDAAGAIASLQPWYGDPLDDGFEIVRAIALLDLGQVSAARAALRREADAHAWMRELCDWLLVAVETRDGTGVPLARAENMLRRAEQVSRSDLFVRVLLPRLRLVGATALLESGETARASEILRELQATQSGPTVTLTAGALLAASDARATGREGRPRDAPGHVPTP